MRSGAGEIIHATCVAIGGAGVLLIGPSGSGKSDLALRLIFSGPDRGPGRPEQGPVLVSDDRVELCADSGVLRASAPDAIAGRLEVRGVGVLSVPYENDVPVALVIELVPPDQVPRLPDRNPAAVSKSGVMVPLIHLAAFEASAPAKVILAVRGIIEDAFAEEVGEEA